MQPKDNPFLQVEDPYKDVKNVKDQATQIQLEMMRLCFEVFHVSVEGQQLMKLLKDRYLQCALVRPDHPQADQLNMYWEGFREAIRGIYNLGLQHQQYINGVTTNGRTTDNPTGSIPTTG